MNTVFLECAEGYPKIFIITGRCVHVYVSQSVFFRTKSCGEIMVMSFHTKKQVGGGQFFDLIRLGDVVSSSTKTDFFKA